MSAQQSVEQRPRDARDELRVQLLGDAPVTERRLHLAGVSTPVLAGGSGTPLVLLHGGIACGGVVWTPVMSRLAERHRIVVPDLPGLGEAEAVGRLDAATFARWCVELLEETCREEPTLVAHSLGASLAARFAAHHSGLLRGLVLCGAPSVGRYRLPLGLLVTAIRFDLRPSKRNGERFARYAFFDLDRLHARDPQWYDAWDAYLRRLAVVPHVKKTMRQLIRSGTKRIPDNELGRIAVPTMLVWGRHDRFVPLGLAEAAHTRLRWPLRVIDDAGHVPHIERPDAFLRALGSLG